MTGGLDDAAAQSLLQRIYAPENAYIDDDGRYRHHVPATITPAERTALAARGLAPDALREFGHDAAVAGLRRAAAEVGERLAANAFVAGLAPTAARWRAVLPGWALGTTMPDHQAQVRGGADVCDVCFVGAVEAVDVTQEWLHGRAGSAPLPGDVCRYLLVLQEALAPAQVPARDAAATSGEPAQPPEPTPREVWVLHATLDLLEQLPPTTRNGGAEAELVRARLVPGWSRAAYRSLLEDLAFLGILQTGDHPGVLTRFTTARERDRRPSVRVEVSAPLGFWTAADGVQRELVDRLFGHLPRPAEQPPAPAPPARPRARHGGGTPRTPSDLRGEPRAGDVYAIGCREDLWVLAYCHEVAEIGGRSRGRMEYLDAVFTALPTQAGVGQAVGLRGRPGGRWQSWCSHLDGTPRVRRVARGVLPPPDPRPEPERREVGHAKDLRHLAQWCFPELDGG